MNENDEKYILTNLRRIDSLNPEDKSIELEKFLYNRNGVLIEDYRDFLWRIINSIMKSSTNNVSFVLTLCRTRQFTYDETLSHLINVPRRNLTFQEIFDIHKYVDDKNKNSVKIHAFLFDRMSDNERKIYKTFHYCNQRAFENGKKEIVKVKTARFLEKDIGNEEVFEILHIVSYFLNNQEFLSFMLRKIDYIFDDDTFFAFRYATTLMRFSHDEHCCNRTNDENVIKPIGKYLKIELLKIYPEFEKLLLAFHLAFSLIDFDYFDCIQLKEGIDNIEHVLDERKDELSVGFRNHKNTLLLVQLEKLKKKVKTRNDSRSVDKIICNENEASRLLHMNERLSFDYLFIDVEDPYQELQVIKQLKDHSDSHYHRRLYLRILDCFVEILDQRRDDVDELTKYLNDFEFNNFQVYKMWASYFNDFKHLEIIAKFMIMEDYEIDRNLSDVVDVAVIFLRKIKEFNMNSTRAIVDTFGSLKPTILYPAGERFVKEHIKNDYWTRRDFTRVLDLLERWSMFLEREQFLKLLLMKITCLPGPNSDVRTRYALTLAQCGYDQNNGNQFDPTENEENAEIVRTIYEYLKFEVRSTSRNRVSIELAVQIFKNFVRVDPESCFIIDNAGVSQELLNFIRELDFDNNQDLCYNVNLHQKIVDLFNTNQVNCEQPSFGSVYQVVSQERAEKFSESKEQNLYFIDHS